MERLTKIQLDRLAKNIVRLRGRAGLTQEKLAEKAEITTRYFQTLEAGTFGGSLAVLVRVKKALGCTWDELFSNL